MKEIVGDSFLIAGFGREGQSVFRHLELKYPSIAITIADEKEIITSDIRGCSFVFGSDYLHGLNKYDTVMRSPSIPKTEPELQEATHVTTATNIFFSECPGTIIGVTGTKGKSTTSSLIHQILNTSYEDVRLVGNIGNPALDALPGSTTNTVFVMELSSYQLDDIHFSPHVAVILPIYPEHLNYHGNFDKYIKAKGNLVDKQNKDDYVIYNGSNLNSKKIALRSQAQHVAYNKRSKTSTAAWIDNDAIWLASEKFRPQRLLTLREIPLLGCANFENVTASIVTSLIMSVDINHIREAIRSFKPLEHRLELVGIYRDITFYNDSLATIPEATIHALEALGEKAETIIAGGFDRGLDFSLLGQYISKSKVINLILLPTTGEKIAQALYSADSKSSININFVSSLLEAVDLAYKITSKGGVCLMSPASASFNLFKDYSDRGNQFKQLVMEFGKSKS